MPGLPLWLRRLAEPRPDDPLALRCARRLVAADARDRVFILAGQAFIALVPLLILIATFSTSTDGDALAGSIVRRFELRGDAADAVHALFSHPPDAGGGISLLSTAILLISLNSFGRSVRRTVELAWEQPRSGVRGARDGLLGVGVLVAMSALLGAISGVAPDGFAGEVVSGAAQLVVGYYGWLIAQNHFLTRRIEIGALRAGAAIGAAAQLAAGRISSAYMPDLIARNTDRYGVIGVAFSLVSWLIIAAAVMVVVAIVGAEVGRNRVAGPSPGTTGEQPSGA